MIGLEPLEGKDFPARRRARRAAWALALAFVVLGSIYSMVTPLFEASDEQWHYPFVQHLARGGGLPVQSPATVGPWRQEGSQPPLYYALAALISRWVPGDYAQILLPNPHADLGVLRPDGNVNMAIHTPSERFPYQGAALAMHLVRWFSVLLGAVTVFFAFLVGLEALPHRPGVALAGAAIAAFTPMFLFIAGSVNNDNLLIALSTVGLWLLLRQLRQPEPLRGWLLLGVVIGLGALAKESALGLLPLTALALLWLAGRERNLRALILRGACVLGAAAVIGGWWYWRNWALYHDPLGFNAFVAVAGPRYPQPTVRQLLAEWQGFVMAYWGLFGGLNVPAPSWFYRALDGLALLGAGGLVLELGRRLVGRRLPAAATAFRLALLVVWPLLVLGGLIRWTLLTMASQGRLIFPAIAALSYLLALGLASWLPAARRGRDAPAYLAAALMGGLAIWTPFAVIAPAYARPPLLTAAQEAAIPHRLDLTFGGQMELLGYRLDASEVRPGQGLAVTLYWRALKPMTQNYSVFVHLLTENELIVGQRDVYPGRGSFPTTQWQPGQAIADTYIVPVSPTTFSPSRVQVEVGLYQKETGQRLEVTDASGQALGDNVRFGQVLVRAEPKDGIANPVFFNLDHKIALVGYDLDRTSARPGETVHLTLYWQALQPMTVNYTVFAHIIGPNNSMHAQKDSWPQGGAAPTSGWHVGQRITDTYDLQIYQDTPPGAYDLEVGMYQSDTLQRLGVLGAGGELEDNRILLNRVRVNP